MPANQISGLLKNKLALIIITIGVLIFFTYGWTGFATITKRSGLTGDLYIYYHVSQTAFFLYNLLVALITISMIIMLLNGLIRGKSRLIKKGYWIFLVLAIILTIGEIYLGVRFTGKG